MGCRHAPTGQSELDAFAGAGVAGALDELLFEESPDEPEEDVLEDEPLSELLELDEPLSPPEPELAGAVLLELDPPRLSVL